MTKTVARRRRLFALLVIARLLPRDGTGRRGPTNRPAARPTPAGPSLRIRRTGSILPSSTATPPSATSASPAGGRIGPGSASTASRGAEGAAAAEATRAARAGYEAAGPFVVNRAAGQAIDVKLHVTAARPAVADVSLRPDRGEGRPAHDPLPDARHGRRRRRAVRRDQRGEGGDRDAAAEPRGVSGGGQGRVPAQGRRHRPRHRPADRPGHRSRRPLHPGRGEVPRRQQVGLDHALVPGGRGPAERPAPTPNALPTRVAGPDWWPFEPKGDASAAGEGDVIGMDDWLDKPAGKHGGVRMVRDALRVRGRHARSSSGASTSSYTGNCAPDKKTADFTAARFAKYGINAVRLHKFSYPNERQRHRRPQRLHPHGPRRASTGSTTSPRKLKEQRRLLRLVAHLRLPRPPRRPRQARSPTTRSPRHTSTATPTPSSTSPRTCRT